MLQLAGAAGGMEKEMIIAATVERQKKGNALDVVPVEMRKKDMGIQRLALKLLDKLFAEHAKAGATIKDIDVAIDANFHAGGITAVAEIFRLRRRRGAANAPEADLQRGFHLG